jgi:hypothetical protein
MPQLQRNEEAVTETADPRWQDLYKIGGITALIGVAITVLAVIAFFIWPYQPGFTSTANVLTSLQNDRLGGLVALDLLFIVGNLLSVLPVLAMYAALKRVNASYALIALIVGVIGVVSLIPARPIAEMVSLSDLYAAAQAALCFLIPVIGMILIFLATLGFVIFQFLMGQRLLQLAQGKSDAPQAA